MNCPLHPLAEGEVTVPKLWSFKISPCRVVVGVPVVACDLCDQWRVLHGAAARELHLAKKDVPGAYRYPVPFWQEITGLKVIKFGDPS